jgi:hypothetical protein
VKFLARFQRIERARRSREEDGVSAAGRFETLETAASLPEVHTSASARFAAPPELPLSVEPRDDDHQPFIRCPACGRDHGRETVHCNCGTALGTPQVRAFNDALWAGLRAEQATERDHRSRALGEDLEEAERLRRARQVLGEQLAREVAERARGRDGFPGSPSGWLLAAAVVAVVALFLRGRPGMGLALAAVAVVVLVARRLRRQVRPPSDPNVRH